MSGSKSENGRVVRKAENPSADGAELRQEGWKPEDISER
jgi:hypothetical protein